MHEAGILSQSFENFSASDCGKNKIRFRREPESPVKRFLRKETGEF
ncbi:hypothetical protein HMPREF1986_01557 [Oribacterium sp. oral taxon 078 str. F0263]|nr:hypothetical protein HMPREF1986_01557 [Oribacterium sp. oral taxon 078 str. F0263]